MSICKFFDIIVKIITIRTSNKCIIFSINSIFVDTFQMNDINIPTKHVDSNLKVYHP